MAGDLQPLDDKFAIVGPDGRPTLYFIKWAQQKQIDIQGAITETQFNELLVQYLLDHQLQEGSGIQITPSGNLSDSPTIAADAQEILDQISTTQGSIIYRNASDWVALAPGTAGYLLETNGAGADPAWVAPTASGGVVVYSFFNDITVGFTLNINTTTYTTLLPFVLKLPYDTFPATHFRLGARIASNAVGQTVSCQLANPSGTPLHTGGNDVTGIPNANTTVDTGWLSIDIALSGLQQIHLDWKGSNATVDVVMVQPFYIMFK